MPGGGASRRCQRSLRGSYAAAALAQSTASLSETTTITEPVQATDVWAQSLIGAGAMLVQRPCATAVAAMPVVGGSGGREVVAVGPGRAGLWSPPEDVVISATVDTTAAVATAADVVNTAVRMRRRRDPRRTMSLTGASPISPSAARSSRAATRGPRSSIAGLLEVVEQAA